MEVYFGNFWREKRKEHEKPGMPISVQKEFEYGSFRWVCPRLYLCEEGIVLDLCRKYDASEFKAFYDKWVDKIDALSPAEQEQITKEEYRLSRNCGWYMYRANFPYQSEDYAILINDPDLLKRLTLQVAAQKEQIYLKLK